ncbi:hypothetical protein P154DRAFT_516854 [Amniculicola lignicola CBS 123094]|uniref:Major facilitator superfamily (MFS) profile domain-containing protein n=1 Tax=Amniculicola lignicola CBS 123094 TaxID=1392246 RepID=A0A6A5X578_9PLEO|nr:hypothetical protein P154DRAFT_516854 [Amniculicola lignicola CBS 123094]
MATNQDGASDERFTPFKSSWRIWGIFFALCLLSFISVVDATIITTSLPTITREIVGAEKYVWIANAYLFASTAPQPFFGQISNIFGRRNPMLVSIALFALGSGIVGPSREMTCKHGLVSTMRCLRRMLKT